MAGADLLLNEVPPLLPKAAFKNVQVGVERADATGKRALDLVAPRRPITVHDLLRHTSGLTYSFFGTGLVKKAYVDNNIGTSADMTNAEFADAIARMPLAYQPGTTWDYSNSTDVLGRVIEVVSGQALSQHLGPQVTRTELYLPGPGYTFGLGFAVRTEAGMAPFEGSIGEYFWGGAGGTYMWVDPGADLIVVFGMQSPKQRTLYRSVLRNLVFGAVVGPAAETPGH